MLGILYVVPTDRVKVPATGRVKVPAGRYVVPTRKDNVIVSAGRTKVPAGRTILVLIYRNYILPIFLAGLNLSTFPTGRVKVPAGRYVVPTGKDNVIVSTGKSKVIPAGRTIKS
ncbi:hypothetical protein Tco_0768698 [Tanacetum coccineum]